MSLLMSSFPILFDDYYWFLGDYVFALLRTRRYPEGDVGPSRHDPGERPACWVPWLAQRPRRPLVRPKGPRAPFFIRKGGIDNNNNTHDKKLLLPLYSNETR